ncbi:MAG: hypothetical protein HZA24_03060 [Nitrospirae bacterium]|nr:hypothetical protein [Nitrospirota bacterium]
MAVPAEAGGEGPPGAAPVSVRRVTGHLLAVADLLEAFGENPHRVRAYRSGAAVLERHGPDLVRHLNDGTLARLPGIGRELAAKVALLAKGVEPPGLAELTRRIPPAAAMLARVPGVDRKLAIYLAARLHVGTVSQLRQLAETHMLRTIPWLPPEREQAIRQALSGLVEGGTP